MSAEKHGPGVEQAFQMLRAFLSLGVDRFDLTQTDLEGRPRGFCPGQSWDLLRRSIPSLLASARHHRHNVIVRPRGAGFRLVQLDDLNPAALERIRGAAFLLLATSPGNHQAWVALRDGSSDLARRLRLCCGADPCASGAARLAGSINFKPRYAPDFPLVTIAATAPGRVVTPAELEASGLAAAAGAAPAWPPPRARSPAPAKRWPSYQRCLSQAPPAHGRDRPDVSRADFTFCLLAIDWGWSVADTGRRLLQISTKAGARGEPYARLTAQRAAAAVDRRLSRPAAGQPHTSDPVSERWE